MILLSSPHSTYRHEHSLVEWGLQQMLELGGWKRGAVWHYDSGNNLLQLRVQQGGDLFERFRTIKPGPVLSNVLANRSVWEGPVQETVFSRAEFEQDKDDYTLLMPLVLPERVTGVAQCIYTAAQRPSVECIQKLIPLADVLATLMNSSQLQAEAVLWSKQLEIIQSISSSLTRLHDLELIANTIPRATKRLIDYHACRVHVVQGDKVVAVAMHSEHEEYTRDSLDQFQVELGEGLTGWVALHGEGILTNDAKADPRAVEVVDTAPIDESMILMPMKAEEDVLGVLSISKLGVDQFGESDARLIRILADQAAVAVRNVRLMDELKDRARDAVRHARQTELIGELATAIASTLDPDVLVRRLAGTVVEATPSDFAVIFRLRPEGRIQASAEHGLSRSAWETLVSSDCNLPLANHVLASRHTYVVHDSNQDPVFSQTKPPFPVRSLVAIPIRLADSLLGVLVVGCYDRPGAFSSEHIQLLEAVSAHAATALENAHLYERQVRDTEANAALSELGQALVASTTEAEVVDASIQTLRRLFAPVGGAVCTRDEQGEWLIKRIWGSEQPDMSSADPCLMAYEAGPPVTEHSDGSHVCVPLSTARGTLGVVSLTFKDTDPFPASRRLVLENVCKYIALAISNQRLYDIARMQSVTDGLTGLHNYRYLEEFLEQEYARHKRTGAPISLLMLDADHFKYINDMYGHGVGDEVLKAVANALQSNVRSSDFVARYGGEEFVVVLPNTSSAGAAHFAEKLRHIISEVRLPEIDEHLRVTVSIGVATLPEHADSVAALGKQADAVLYEAKTERNRVRIAATRGTEPTTGEAARIH